MDKQTTRAFAAGLFTASLALLVYSQTTSPSEITDKKIINKLEKKDYIVLSTAEYDQQKKTIDQLQKKVDDLSKTNETKKETVPNEKSNESHYTLQITPGMASSDIGETLEKAGIIKSAEEFNSFLTDNDYARKIQVGEYKLYSSMTMKQIAVVLTTK
ncbi:endolytic transglycosylase MltG [Bacillus sp. Hm123]|uniref:endolytic transglycosylase MltG n=1 Tax=Bacillus sp. Hm123 TaxID=3450745 RepID=UPI003F4373FE